MWVPANSSKYFIEPSRGRLGAPAPHGKGKFGPNWLRTLPSDRKVLIPAAFALASLILIQCPSSIIGFALPTGARVEDVSHGQLLARTVNGTFESYRVPLCITTGDNHIEPAHGDLKIGIPKTR